MGTSIPNQLDRVLRTVHLLVNNFSNQPGSIQKITSDRTPAGAIYDLYEPPHTAVSTYILIYGLDLAGEKDPRMVRFASACSSAGLRAAVPDLAGLKSYCFSIVDLQIIAELADHLHQRFNSPIGMIGFSAGGSYALSVAAEKQVDWIDPLLLFSPYYSLDGVPPIQKSFVTGYPVTERDWDHFIWCQLVFNFRNLDQTDFTQVERAELIDLLTEYCSASQERKLAFFQKVFKDRPTHDINDNILAGEDLSAFTLRGKLDRVKGRVFIFHDPDDYFIPPEHSRYILAELQKRQQPAAQSLLITNLISHVTPKYRFRLSESLQAVRMLNNLFPR